MNHLRKRILFLGKNNSKQRADSKKRVKKKQAKGNGPRDDLRQIRTQDKRKLDGSADFGAEKIALTTKYDSRYR